MIVTLNQKYTKQRIRLNNENSKIAYQEILASIHKKPFKKTLGLVSPDFEVSVSLHGKLKYFKIYERGHLIFDTESNQYFVFKIGIKWYEMLIKRLETLLKENPDYFHQKNEPEIKRIGFKRLNTSLGIPSISPSFSKVKKREALFTAGVFGSKRISRSREVGVSKKREGISMKKSSIKKASAKKSSKKKVSRKTFAKKAAKKKK